MKDVIIAMGAFHITQSLYFKMPIYLIPIIINIRIHPRDLSIIDQPFSHMHFVVDRQMFNQNNFGQLN